MTLHIPRLGIRHLLALVAITAVSLRIDSFPSGRLGGLYPLRVNLIGPPGKPIALVEAGTESTVERADAELNDPEDPPIEIRPVPLFAGRPFEVSVRWKSEISLLSGRELNPWQHRALVLRIVYADGTTQWVTRWIPSRRATRELTVIVP